MSADPVFSHQTIVNYIYNDSAGEESKDIDEAKNQDSKVSLLFQIIDSLKPDVVIKKKAEDVTSLAFSFKELDDLLLEYFSGTLTARKAQRFMDALIFLPIFYRRLMVKLEEASPELTTHELKDSAAVETKSDAEVVADVVRMVKRRGEKGGLVVTGRRSGFLNTIDYLIDLLRRVPSYGFGIIFTAITVIGGYAIYNKIAENKFYAQFDYTREVPYDPVTSSTRAGSELAKGDPVFRAIVDQYEIGLGYYLAWDYRQAIQVFQRIKTGTELLELKGLPLDRQDFWRNFYFYFGVSHLALLAGEKSELSEQEKQAHLSGAISGLSRANSIVHEYGLEKGDRELYFLGLAYGFSQQTGKAVELLKAIELDSQFYEISQTLSQKWTN